MIPRGVKDLVTENDNQTYDVVRLTIFFALLIMDILTVYTVLVKQDDWKDLITPFATSTALLIGSSGIGLYFKSGSDRPITQEQDNEPPSQTN